MKRTVCFVMAALAGAYWGMAQRSEILDRVPRVNAEWVETTQDKLEADLQSGWVTLTGNVAVRTADHQLTADFARMNRESGDVQAQGNVVITQTGLGTWRGAEIDYNYKTGKGLAKASVFQSGVFTMHAKEMSCAEDGLYSGTGMAFTTCTNAPGHWHWHLSGDARFKDNESIRFYHAVPYFFGVPIFYLPYWYRSLDGQYGLRTVPGYTSRWGAFLLNSYTLNLYTAERSGGAVKLDSITRADYRTLRGVGVGETLRWDLNQWGRGDLGFYHLWDQSPGKKQKDENWMSTIPYNRYRIRLLHEADLTPRDQFIVRGLYVSDSQIQHDFFERHSREESVPINIVSLEHREHAWAAGVMVSGPLNTFYGGVSRLPEAWLNIVPQSLFGTGFIYEGQTRGGYLERSAAHYDRVSDPIYGYYPGPWADYETVRINTAHRLTYPFKLFDALSVVPRAGYQGSYYTRSTADNNVFRHTVDLGATASMRAVADWGNGWRHTFEPYLDYSWQPTFWNAGQDGDLYLFDRIERAFEWQDQFGMDGVWLPYNWHGFRPGVRNVIQTRGGASGAPRTLFDWDVYGAVQLPTPNGDVEPNLPEEGLRFLGSKVLFNPTEDLSLRAVGEWDVKQDKMAYVDFNVRYRLSEHFNIGGGYLERDHALYDYRPSPVAGWNQVNDQVLYGGFLHTINDNWAWSLFARYDTDGHSFHEVGGFIQRSLDCLVFQLRSSYLPSYTRIDNTERDSDFRVSFMMWFRAEGRKDREDWLGW